MQRWSQSEQGRQLGGGLVSSDRPRPSDTFESVAGVRALSRGRNTHARERIQPSPSHDCAARSIGGPPRRIGAASVRTLAASFRGPHRTRFDLFTRAHDYENSFRRRLCSHRPRCAFAQTPADARVDAIFVRYNAGTPGCALGVVRDAVVLLAQQSGISLDDDVRKFIPEIPDYGKTITLPT
jgi:hypothetical protein